MADSNLAATIGTEYARMLHGIIPKIEDALRRGHTKASFQVNAKFNVNAKTGGVDVTLSQTASIPMETADFKLSYLSGQLSLFEASQSAARMTDASTPTRSANTGGALT
jgi:hypothetical protein